MPAMTSSLFEGAELTSESGKTYLAVSSLGQSNVWTGAEKENFGNIVVIKAPSDSDPHGSWPAFCDEMVQHELFKDSKHVRLQVDRIPPNRNGPPMLVLEIAEMTLWQARTKRPLSRGEIVAIIKGILQGLAEIHAKGMVYGDLKMENVMLSGFDVNTPGDGSSLEVKIGDLGTVAAPATGTLQPVAYRAPEVFFKEEITPAADIWGLGVIYSHLVEAQLAFSKSGIYDDLTSSSTTVNQREHAVGKQISKDYDLRNTDYYRHCALPLRSPRPTSGNHWEKRGLDARDVEFLERVMKADPTERPTARAILDSYWFEGGGLENKEKATDEAEADEKTHSAVKPTIRAVPSSPSSPVQEIQPSRSISNSSRKRRIDLGLAESDDISVHIQPKKKVETYPSPRQVPSRLTGSAGKGGTYLNYR